MMTRRNLFFIPLFLGRLGKARSIDCTGIQLYVNRVAYDEGESVVFQVDGKLYHAEWYVTSPPCDCTQKGWVLQGACEEGTMTGVAPIPCPPAYDPSAVYEQAGTQVSYNGNAWQNEWYVGSNVFPGDDPSNGWALVGPCATNGGETTTTTSNLRSLSTTTTSSNAVPVQPTIGPITQVPLQPTMNPIPVQPTMNPIPVQPTIGPITQVPLQPTMNPIPVQPTIGPVTRVPLVPTYPPIKFTTTTSKSSSGGNFPNTVTDINPGASNHLKQQITYDAAPAGYPTDAQMNDAAQKLIGSDNTGNLKMVQDAIVALGMDTIMAITPGAAANPENVKRVEKLLSQDQFEAFFPVRDSRYTYQGFLQGIGAFPAYCKTYSDKDSDTICKKLMAMSFAHFVQETGANWPELDCATALQDVNHSNPGCALSTSPQTIIPNHHQGLWFLMESGADPNAASTGMYCSCDPADIYESFYPGGFTSSGVSYGYNGHGSKQISYNYNFGSFSQSLYGDQAYLIDNPSMVATTWLNFASAIWFSTFPQSPKPPMTWVVDGTWVPNAVDTSNGMAQGFGATIVIINGGIECGSGTESAQASNRIASYQAIAAEWNLDISGEQLSCANSKGFASGSAGETNVYLDKDWSQDQACAIVNYQTPWQVLVPNDYKLCVDWYARGTSKDGKTGRVTYRHGQGQ